MLILSRITRGSRIMMFKIKIVDMKSREIEDILLIEGMFETINDVAYGICSDLTNKKRRFFDYYVEEV